MSARKKTTRAPRVPGAIRVQLDLPAETTPAIADALRAVARSLGGELVERTDAAPGAYSLTVHEGSSAEDLATARAAAVLADADAPTIAAFKAAIAAKEG